VLCPAARAMAGEQPATSAGSSRCHASVTAAEGSASTASSPKRPRASEAALALLLQARSLMNSSGELEEACNHLDACLVALESKLPLKRAPPPVPPSAASSDVLKALATSALPPSPQRSQQTQTQSSLSTQQTAGTQADGPKSADASSQVVPASAHAASQAVVAMQSVATSQSAGTQAVLGLRQPQENRLR